VKSFQSVRGEPVEPQAKRIENIDPSTSSGRTGYAKLFMRRFTRVPTENPEEPEGEAEDLTRSKNGLY